MEYKSIILFIVLSLSLSISWANDFQLFEQNTIPQFILEDIKHEILEVDSFDLKLEERKSLIHQIDSTKNLSFSDMDLLFEKYFQIKQSLTKNNSSEIIEIKPAQISAQKSHSIHQLDDYVKNRVGSGTYAEIQKGQTNVLILGGDQNSFNEYLKTQPNVDFKNIQRIPSLYEQWGLSKFYLPSPNRGEKAQLIWLVPPSTRYVRHYSTMFQTLTNAKVKSFIDFKVLEQIEKQSKQNAEIILEKTKVDYIAFGYNRLWKKALSEDSNLVLLNEFDFQDKSLQSGLKVLSVFNNESKQIINIGLFSSEKTVWGELAALQLKSFLNPQLKGLIFMGSAGSLMTEINPYDLSVPKNFYRPGQSIKIDNFINQQKINLDPNQTIHFDRSHGNTFSPIEQNKKYIATLDAKNIQTIDVEQSLVAEAVSDYNRRNKTEIKFGAINLITDKPYSVLSKESVKNSLDHLNSERKETARLNAVKMSLISILNNEKQSRSVKCIDLFL